MRKQIDRTAAIAHASTHAATTVAASRFAQCLASQRGLANWQRLSRIVTLTDEGLTMRRYMFTFDDGQCEIFSGYNCREVVAAFNAAHPGARLHHITALR